MEKPQINEQFIGCSKIELDTLRRRDENRLEAHKRREKFYNWCVAQGIAERTVTKENKILITNYKVIDYEKFHQAAERHSIEVGCSKRPQK